VKQSVEQTGEPAEYEAEGAATPISSGAGSLPPESVGSYNELLICIHAAGSHLGRFAGMVTRVKPNARTFLIDRGAGVSGTGLHLSQQRRTTLRGSETTALMAGPGISLTRHLYGDRLQFLHLPMSKRQRTIKGSIIGS
jgi:hypothetical protein